MANERRYKKLLKTQKKVKNRLFKDFKSYVNKIATIVETSLRESWFWVDVNQKQFSIFWDAQNDLINSTLFFNDTMLEYLLWNEKVMAVDGMQQVSNQIDFEINFNIRISEANKYIAFKRQFLKDTVINTNQTAILDIVDQALIDWTSWQEVWRQIRKSTSVWAFSVSRAEMIAVNEMWNAFEFWRWTTVNQFRIETWNKVEKIWDTVWDDKVTQLCMENWHQWWIQFWADFQSWDQTAPRAANPRCRCTVNFRRAWTNF